MTSNTPPPDDPGVRPESPAQGITVGGVEAVIALQSMPLELSSMTDSYSTLARALGVPQAFPWQRRLLDAFVRGEVPSGLDIPTGLGKTAVMAIWLVARSLNPELPRRLVYVVDRRAVVDQATSVAERLREFVGNEAELASRLGLTSALPISTLRGQYTDNKQWLDDPSTPAIVLGTLDMVGSRLLFSGYGVSRRMRPYHAGLLGSDALFVLDEAHLAHAFDGLLREVCDRARWGGVGLESLVPGVRVLALSATGRASSASFSLDEQDELHADVRRRLDAHKAVRVVGPAGGDSTDAFAEVVAKQAWALTSDGTTAARLLIFVESRRVASEVCEALRRLARGDGSVPRIEIHVELLVGGRRVAERQAAAERLSALGFVAGSTVRVASPSFVVATSAGEVGIDLDADHAVFDVVEWERFVQRLGRVNRRGEGEAQVVVVPIEADKKTIEALEREAKLAKAGTRNPRAVETIDALPNVFGDPQTEEDDGADGGEDDVDDESEVGERDDTEENGDGAGEDGDGDGDKGPKRLKPEDRERVARWRRREASLQLLSALPAVGAAQDGSPAAIRALVRDARFAARIADASTPPPLWPELSGAVVESWSMTSLDEHTGRPPVGPWIRGWVDEEAQTTVAWRTFLPRPPDAEPFFDAAPVETAERLEVERALVFEWLKKRADALVKRLKSKKEGPAAVAESERGSEADRPLLSEDDVAFYVLGDAPSPWTLRAVSTLDKRAKDALLRDLAGATLVVDARMGGLDASGLLDSKADSATDASESCRLGFRVLEVTDLSVPTEDLKWRREASFVARTNYEGEAQSWLVVESDIERSSTTADGRSTGREQSLAAHQQAVERHARRIAHGVGLPQSAADLLALAAVLHDEGKRADNWQRAFRAPPHKRPLGKTTSRPIQAVLANYRHEFGSIPYAEKDERVRALSEEDRALVLHLIASHHGFARPLLRVDGCSDAPPSALKERARAVALRFAQMESRWGPWGLAWWEALLRSADQQASRENDARGGDHD